MRRSLLLLPSLLGSAGGGDGASSFPPSFPPSLGLSLAQQEGMEPLLPSLPGSGGGRNGNGCGSFGDPSPSGQAGCRPAGPTSPDPKDAPMKGLGLWLSERHTGGDTDFRSFREVWSCTKQLEGPPSVPSPRQCWQHNKGSQGGSLGQVLADPGAAAALSHLGGIRG